MKVAGPRQRPEGCPTTVSGVKTHQILIPLLFCALIVTSGCFGVHGVAPYGPDVRVLPPGTPVEVSRRYQKWYALWGMLPLSDGDHPRDIIAREKLVEVRVAMEDSVEDIVSGIIYFFVFPIGIIVPQTIIVEGNRAPRDSAPVDGAASSDS